MSADKLGMANQVGKFFVSQGTDKGRPLSPDSNV
jgi:hypothetical protein